MPEKKDIYKSYGQKLISLFVKLLFSGESYSLTELARILDCSKQTVLRLVNDIRMSYGVEIEEFTQGIRKYYRIQKKGRTIPVVPMTAMEMNVLQMCRAFTEHLLGKQLFEEAARALMKSQALLPEEMKPFQQHFASFSSGVIDYSPHQDTIRILVEAMDKKRVCRVTYQPLMETKPKSYYIKPFKIFSHRDTLYLHNRLARTPGKPYKEPEFDPLLAIHRIRNVEMTDRFFEFPKNYDFAKVFNRNFGVMKDESFRVEIEFIGWAARYVAERTWTPDQKIKRIGQDKILLTFTASSEPELISWVLSFGAEARVMKPGWVREEILNIAQKMVDNHKRRH